MRVTVRSPAEFRYTAQTGNPNCSGRNLLIVHGSNILRIPMNVIRQIKIKREQADSRPGSGTKSESERRLESPNTREPIWQFTEGLDWFKWTGRVE